MTNVSKLDAAVAVRAFFLGFFLLTFSTLASEKAQSSTPQWTGESKKIFEETVALFEASKLVNDKSQGKAMRAKIDRSVNWDKISELSIGKAAWQKHKKQRGEFRDLLKAIVSKTAYSRMTKFWDGTTYKISKIELKGKDKAEVVSDFDDQNESYELIYYMQKLSGHWVVYDIAFEGVQYAENINAQISYFLKQEKGNFDALLKKMRKRVNEL